jgi:hypothetical protein
LKFEALTAFQMRVRFSRAPPIEPVFSLPNLKDYGISVKKKNNVTPGKTFVAARRRDA